MAYDGCLEHCNVYTKPFPLVFRCGFHDFLPPDTPTKWEQTSQAVAKRCAMLKNQPEKHKLIQNCEITLNAPLVLSV